MERKSNKKSFSDEKKPRPKKKIIFYVLLIGIAIASPFVIYWILQLSLNTSSPMVVVVSGSMEPTLSKGDLLFLYGKDPADIKNGTAEEKNGDIIVFDAHGYWPNPPDEPIVHRVINKTLREDGLWWFKTKGDANSVEDPWIPESQILGVVCGVVPFIGWVKILFTESGLLIPLIVIILFVLIISLVWDFMNEAKNDDQSKPIDFHEKKEDLRSNS
ncbi:MAG: signal peptidase I [Candidatus Lokiarchaeota archaeon]|nr:signal peptidase I [Candidatus Lokiarchaeota archaeon]